MTADIIDPIWQRHARRALTARGHTPTPRAVEVEAAQRAARHDRDRQRADQADTLAAELGPAAAALADGGVTWSDMAAALYLHRRMRGPVLHRLIAAGWLVERGCPPRLHPGPGGAG